MKKEVFSLDNLLLWPAILTGNGNNARFAEEQLNHAVCGASPLEFHWQGYTRADGAIAVLSCQEYSQIWIELLYWVKSIEDLRSWPCDQLDFREVFDQLIPTLDFRWVDFWPTDVTLLIQCCFHGNGWYQFPEFDSPVVFGSFSFPLS